MNMKAFACGVVLLLCGSFARSTPSQQPETLKLSDLVNHPERWPAAVKVLKDFKFSAGGGLKAGQMVKVLEFKGAQVLVDAGNQSSFEVAPADCDLLDAANKAWAALTSAQRAVDPQCLLKDASLWPERVTCLSGFRLDDGSELAPGGEYQFLSIDREGAKFYAPAQHTTLVAELSQTDLITRARQRALVEPEKRPSRIAAVLQKGLVDSEGKPFTSAAIDDARLYVLYFGASWCGPCRKFSPSLVKFVNDNAKANPRMVTVLMSNDKESADMLEYMKEEKMPWPALPLATLLQTPLLLGLAGDAIPRLVILDHHGLVLASSVENGTYVGVDRPLKALAKLVESGVAK